MLTYTEQVHVLFGTTIAAIGGTAWVSERNPGSRARRIWPVLCFLLGVFLFIPVDVGTGAYHRIGVWATFVSVVPDSAAYWVQRWVRPLGQLHVIEHKVTGVLAMILGATELGRATGRLTRPGWAWVLPAALIGMGLALGIHGGTPQHLPTRVEQMHHWFLGAGLGGSGIVLLLVETGRLPVAWRNLWPIVLLLLGLDLALFYRLPSMT